MSRPSNPDATDVEPSHGDGYTDREVPEQIGEALVALGGGDHAPETLGGFLSLADSDVFSPGELEAEEMLVTDDSRHVVRLAGRTVHTYCILDALVLAFLEDEPIDVETRPPGAEETIAFTASPEGLAGVPKDGVVSFGFSTKLETDRAAYEDAAPTEVQATIHELGCPRINLFEDLQAYEDWAEDADAVTMPLPLPEALALARDTVEAWNGSS